MKKYLWLEVMRGGAAIWVLLHHAVQTTDAFFGEISFPFFSRGHLGVDFFFILSGFIILSASSRMLADKKTVAEYFALRLVRIYVPYLPIGIGIYFAYIILPDMSAASREIGLLTSLTLLPTEQVTALSVAWTLQHELIFYFLFSTFFVSRYVFISVMGAWLSSILIIYFLEYTYFAFFDVLFSPINLWFFVGMGLFFLPSFNIKKLPFFLMLFFLSCALYLLVVNGFDRVYIGIVFSIFIFLFTKARYLNFSAPKVLVYFGAASYSIYLVHDPVQSVVARIILQLPVALSTPWVFAVISFASLLGGLIYYVTYEKNVVSLLKAKTQSWFSNRSENSTIQLGQD